MGERKLIRTAIGGTIGTGLFIGSGGALHNSGPAGALIAYAFVGTLVYSVSKLNLMPRLLIVIQSLTIHLILPVVGLGEMATFIPVSGAFTTYAARFVDPSLGFAMGWIYCELGFCCSASIHC